VERQGAQHRRRGLQGNLSSITAATNTGYVGSNTDTGHPTGSPAFAVIQDTHELNYGTLDDFLVESIHQQYKWALALTKVYYGTAATRNYWTVARPAGAKVCRWRSISARTSTVS